MEPKFCTTCQKELPLDPVQPWSDSFPVISSQRFGVGPFTLAFVLQMPQMHKILNQNFVALFIFHF
jgi:hypothetical protein